MKKKLKLGKNKILLGVCSGIAEYLDIDSAIIRILWVLGTIVSIGFGILLYLVFWLIMRSNK
ncbi:MAG TPA: PspC domain-containing protein [Candidatus Diapherotrites archaeon]|uniref:PspC domain-containing protein n=1 Tax=Candidatus Iainarchaeum sp. TaxID=3101447 RepID=A0A7J4JXL3_9ARCH|nr:PspC domain-containing protein [Candidatus Diapherotrites archaeon]